VINVYPFVLLKKELVLNKCIVLKSFNKEANNNLLEKINEICGNGGSSGSFYLKCNTPCYVSKIDRSSAYCFRSSS